MIKSNKKSKLKKTYTPLVIVMLIILIIYTISLLGLLAWGGMSSFKGFIDFEDHPYQLPMVWKFSNYPEVFNGFYITNKSGKVVYLSEMFFNTFFIACSQALASTIVPLITAYACARFQNKFSGVLRSTVLITMIVPIVGNTASTIDMQMMLGIYDNIWFHWIAVAHFLGMYFLVFYGVIKSFPISYVEAAKIDGASNLRVMLQISFPLVFNTAATIFLLNFISYWNDYQGPLMYLPSYPTIANAFFIIVKVTAPDASIDTFPHKLASTMILVVPILTIFLIFQKRLMGNLTLGGVKG